MYLRIAALLICVLGVAGQAQTPAPAQPPVAPQTPPLLQKPALEVGEFSPADLQALSGEAETQLLKLNRALRESLKNKGDEQLTTSIEKAMREARHRIRDQNEIASMLESDRTSKSKYFLGGLMITFPLIDAQMALASGKKTVFTGALGAEIGMMIVVKMSNGRPNGLTTAGTFIISSDQTLNFNVHTETMNFDYLRPFGGPRFKFMWFAKNEDGYNVANLWDTEGHYTGGGIEGQNRAGSTIGESNKIARGSVRAYVKTPMHFIDRFGNISYYPKFSKPSAYILPSISFGGDGSTESSVAIGLKELYIKYFLSNDGEGYGFNFFD